MHVACMANYSALWRLVRGSGRLEHHRRQLVLAHRTGGLATPSGYATEAGRVLGFELRKC